MFFFIKNSIVHSFWHGPPLSYFHIRRNLENRKKPLPVWIMNSVDLNRKNTLNSVRVYNNRYGIISQLGVIILGWTVFLANILGMNNNSCALCLKYNSTQISKCHVECMNSRRLFRVCSRGPCDILDIFHGHGTSRHVWIMLWGLATGMLACQHPTQVCQLGG